MAGGNVVDRYGDVGLDGRRLSMVITPGALQVKRYLPTGEPDPEKPKRGAITEFSGRSRQRMLFRFASVDWTEIGMPLGIVTLTYPREWPGDGRVVKDHHQRFRNAWERTWGQPKAVWCLEFQRRGAPHLHMYAGLPAGGTELRQWGRQQWYRIVGSGDERHRVRGLHLRVCRMGTAQENADRVAEYFWLHSGKEYQKEVPEHFQNVGRFWGMWGVAGREHERLMTVGEYVQVRRALHKIREKRAGRRIPRAGGLQGLWTLAGGAEDTGLRLAAWATELDRLRQSERAEGERGEITQHAVWRAVR